MKYYFFDTSGIFGIFRREQHTNEMGDKYWEAHNEFSEGKARSGCGNIIVSHILSLETIKNMFDFLSRDSDNKDLILQNMFRFQVEYDHWIKINVTKDILSKAVELMNKYSELKSYDAIQKLI